MSRNGSGIYSLPSGNPVVSGTLITSTWANNTLSDVAIELTNSLPRDGQAPMTAPLKLVDGTASSPSLVFNAEQTTGLYRIGTNQLGVAIGGVLKLTLSATDSTLAGPLSIGGAITATGGTLSGPLSVTTLTATSGTISGLLSVTTLTATSGTISGPLSVTTLNATGGTLSGPLSVPAGATGSQVPQSQEVTHASDLAASSGAGLVGWIQSGVGVIARTVQAKQRDHVSALDFGATGLGIASDNAAIQAAVDAHALVYLSPGTYLAHRISIPAGHVLYGAGESTIIKRDYYIGAVETALTILAANSQLRDLVIDGNKAAAPAAWGTGTYIQNVDGAAVDGVKYKDCKRDGLFALDADDFTLTNITTETNDRAGIAVTGNCHGFDISHIRSTGDTIAGVDLEPDVASSENTGFSVSDVIVAGCLLSVQGLSTSIVNRGGVFSNLVAHNAGTIRFNKFDDLAVSGISCDSTSSLKIEDSYPTVFGRGTGNFSSISLAGRASPGVNLVNEPYFTSHASFLWTQLLTANGSIAHVLDATLNKYVASIAVAAGGAGNYAFYVSPSFTVGADEWVSLGGMLKAVTGRPYIEVQYRAGAVILDTYRGAGGVAADGVWHKFLKYTKTPATCDNVRFLIGGGYDTVGNFAGLFDGFYVYRDAFKTDAGPVDKTLRAAKAYDLVNIADGVGVSTTVTCTGTALGDSTTATFSLDLQGVMLASWVSAANTVSVRFQNESGGAIDLANGVLKVEVRK